MIDLLYKMNRKERGVDEQVNLEIWLQSFFWLHCVAKKAASPEVLRPNCLNGIGRKGGFLSRIEQERHFGPPLILRGPLHRKQTTTMFI